jgi:copper chaperone CopZ
MTIIRAFIIGTLSILFVWAIILPPAFAGPPQKVILRVDGLACPFCAYGMEKKLKRLENLEKLDIKINEGLVVLYFKEGAKIDKDLIIKKVKEAGFTPRELKIEDESKPVAGQADALKGKEIRLNIEGMACDGCVSRVEAALRKVDCVKEVSVSLAKNEATILCAGDKKDREKLVAAVNALGFKAKLISKDKENTK